MAIRGERTGSGELRKDALFLWAGLLSGPETEPLAKPVRQGIDGLKAADQATCDAEELAIEKSALLERAEYVHDNLHRELELDVLKSVKKKRDDAGYRSVYPHGLSALIALSGKEQERAVTNMLQALEENHPELSKQYKQPLSELARNATLAEEAWADAESKAGQAFQTERLQRANLVRIMQRTEGALSALFPGDRSRVRSYFRDFRRTRREDPATPPAAE